LKWKRTEIVLLERKEVIEEKMKNKDNY